MKRRTYELQGKDVPTQLQGKVITIQEPENLADAVTMTEKGESDVVAKFADGYVIALQGLLRGRSGKEGATQESLQAFADGYKYTVAVAGEGKPREVKPQTKVQRKAADVGNKIFDRALSDEAYRTKLFRLGAITQEDLDEYSAAREEAAAAGANIGKEARGRQPEGVTA